MCLAEQDLNWKYNLRTGISAEKILGCITASVGLQLSLPQNKRLMVLRSCLKPLTIDIMDAIIVMGVCPLL